MENIKPLPEQIKAFMEAPDDGKPIVMINLLKYREKIGTRSVSDSIGLDPKRMAELHREISADYWKAVEDWRRRFAQAIVTIAELPDDMRGPIPEIFLRGQLSREEMAELDARLADEFGYERPGSAGGAISPQPADDEAGGGD